MTRNPRPEDDLPSASGPYVLVCGRCEAILDERYQAAARVDRAADEHALREHPGDERVIVLPVEASAADERSDEVIEAAARLQADIDRDAAPKAG